MNYSSKLKKNTKGSSASTLMACVMVCVNTCRYSCTAKNAAEHPRFGRKVLSNKNDK
ncbi:Uncharacterised protein [Streptococcus pneumoniae]|jgi:hypothetical protein|uniref:hypothetical protein n=1 Tax=Streptococcus pneumoniae TaxID=1313 RepID=UPI0010245029|nr:hypothetical protein [Streptococcus pneumoniae]MDG7066419.1 hypothetical protein [Streptococcus pneumoniae]MDG7673898.1 hypothetical protein [Streptococcus pneumoniae]MDG8229750.1 hypothetical protein [Streptococcus pneumoniae]MDG8394499.1 hypothetical protein [Streptococcus pneumoniae]MDG8839394.1 hypothetical protein [Streptococcus pneumoniae]